MPDLNVDSLSADERDLYLLGRVPEYWQVRREDYPDQTDFKRVEKQRSRQREDYNDLVRRCWLGQPPAELERQMRQQLGYYSGLMHAPLYQALLAICLERWHYVRNLPNAAKLPNRLRLPPLSEIYPLYLGRFPTPTNSLECNFNQQRLSTTDLHGQPEKIAEILQGCRSRHRLNRAQLAQEQQARKRQRSQATNPFNNELRRVSEVLNAPGGLHYSVDEVSLMLSAKTRLALAYRGRSLNELTLVVG